MHRTQNPTAPAADTDDSTVVVTPADILRGAARYLELHDWVQGTYYAAWDPFPPACTDGAIGMATYGQKLGFPGETDDPRHADYQRALAYLIDYLKTNGHDVWPDVDPADLDSYGPDLFVWNDTDGQTAENVIATLRAAADDWNWTHATEDDLETYGENELDNDRVPTREGFLAWLSAR